MMSRINKKKREGVSTTIERKVDSIKEIIRNVLIYVMTCDIIFIYLFVYLLHTKWLH
jgi:hypothetical protein